MGIRYTSIFLYSLDIYLWVRFIGPGTLPDNKTPVYTNTMSYNLIKIKAWDLVSP
jgi:hypothetical protein